MLHEPGALFWVLIVLPLMLVFLAVGLVLATVSLALSLLFSPLGLVVAVAVAYWMGRRRTTRTTLRSAY